MSIFDKDVPGPRPLPTGKAPSGTGFIKPSTFTPVRAESPALSVMTDLKQVSAATAVADANLAQATQRMISRGVRLLLVVNRDDEVIGLITARDTQGERPIQIVQDRGGKFAHYRRIPSLRHYVLVSQDPVRIEHFLRQVDGTWVLREHGSGDTVALDDLGVSLDVNAVYADLPEEPPEASPEG